MTNPAGSSHSERRQKRRVQISQKVRVRPANPIGPGFEEVQATMNVCRDGIYFPTELPGYRQGMELFVTFPYSDMPGAINLDYLGSVVRVDTLTHGRFGVAVHLKSTRPAPGRRG